MAWTGLSLAVAAALLAHRGVRLLSRPQWSTLREIGQASVRNTWLNNALQAPTLLTPMLVTALLGAAQGGAYYVAATVMSAAVFATVTCAVRLAALVAGALAGGLAGVSVALLVVMSAEGGYAIPALRRALKGDSTAARETKRISVLTTL